MPSQMGTFNLLYTSSVPDATLDRWTRTRWGDTRYEQFHGQDGKVEVSVTIPNNGDDRAAVEAIISAHEGAGFLSRDTYRNPS